MPKRARTIVSAAALVAGVISIPAAQAQAQAPANLCTDTGVTFGYFNGIRTTEGNAQVDLGYLEQSFGRTTSTGEEIDYELFYNSTSYVEGDFTSPGWTDIYETFQQRLSEQPEVVRRRFELFWEALRGGGTFSDRLVAVVPSYVNLLTSFTDSLAALLARLVAERIPRIAGAPPTSANYARHRNQIDTAVLEGRKLLLFGHSQGSLFADRAYDYAVQRAGADAVRIVYAAPAAPLASVGNRPYVLADNDIVINTLLRLTGSVVAPNIRIPPLRHAAGRT